jgi:hypothetical protein
MRTSPKAHPSGMPVGSANGFAWYIGGLSDVTLPNHASPSSSKMKLARVGSVPFSPEVSNGA